MLNALGITVLAEPGYEADDLIATLATQGSKAGYRVLVVTGDRDAPCNWSVPTSPCSTPAMRGVSELTRFTRTPFWRSTD